MKQEIELFEQLKVGNILGEGVLWDSRINTLFWTDIEASVLYSWHSEKGIQKFACPERLGSFALSSAPLTFICAFASGFAIFSAHSGEIEWLAKVEGDLPHTRLNDGRTDRQGRFFAGSYNEGHGSKSGNLYRLNNDASLSPQLRDVEIANSLCWSPDGTRVYFADSAKQCIQSGAYQTELGQISGLEDWVHTDKNAFPDGSCIDAEGFLWNAQWGSASVVRYAPNGEQDLALSLPCKQPSCVSFGGENLDLLFVTTARRGLSNEYLKMHPANGDLLIFRTPYRGIAESICRYPI